MINTEKIYYQLVSSSLADMVLIYLTSQCTYAVKWLIPLTSAYSPATIVKNYHFFSTTPIPTRYVIIEMAK